MGISADWKKIYDITEKLICQKTPFDLEQSLAENINDIIPADRGMPMFEYRKNRPYCTRWPEYSDSLIPKFNSHFGNVCPVPFRTDTMSLGPVSWKKYSHSEYDADFNLPLDIGHTMAYGFSDPYDRKLTIVALNRSRRARPFSPVDVNNFRLIVRMFGKLYIQHKVSCTAYEQLIMHANAQYGIQPLSRREMEICLLLCRRCTSGRIAELLSISPRTVECHCLHIYNKMNVKNRRELLHLIFSENFDYN